MNWRSSTLVCALLLTAGCAKTPPRVDLGVDLYLHPEAARVEDVILQAAIRRQITKSLAPNTGLVHVRVIDGVVFLSGSVASEADLKRAEEIARTIDVRIDQEPIKPSDVHRERLQVTQ